MIQLPYTDNLKNNGAEWRQKAQSEKEQRDLVELVCQAYQEGFYKSTSPYPTRKRLDARDYAYALFPEAKTAVEAYSSYTKSRGTLPKTPDVYLGSLIVHGLRHLIPKSKVQKPKKVSMSDSVKGKYEAWVMDNDFIVNDEVISHFTGITTVHLQDTRADLRKVGYEFTQVKEGWLVTQRPVVVSEKTVIENAINDMTKEELIAILIKKLAE